MVGGWRCAIQDHHPIKNPSESLPEDLLENLDVSNRAIRITDSLHYHSLTLPQLILSGPETQPKHKVFGFGWDIPQTSRLISPSGRPDPKTFTPSLGAEENKVSCADVHDPKARFGIGKLQASWLPTESGSRNCLDNSLPSRGRNLGYSDLDSFTRTKVQN